MRRLSYGLSLIHIFTTGSVFNQTSIMWSLAWAVVALYVANGNNERISSGNFSDKREGDTITLAERCV